MVEFGSIYSIFSQSYFLAKGRLIN